MNLENELEPLLAQLTTYFDEFVARCYGTDNDKYRIATNEAWQALLHLGTRFRGYYVLDRFDVDAVSDQLFDPKVDVAPQANGVPSADWYGAIGGSSLFSKIVGADYYVTENLRDLLGSDTTWAGNDKIPGTNKFSGAAAEAFRTGFVARFRAAAQTQAAHAGALALVANELAADVTLAKRSVLWICESLVRYVGGPVDPPPAPVLGQADWGNEPVEKEDYVSKAAEIVERLSEVADTILSLTDPVADVVKGIHYGALLVEKSREPHPPTPTPTWRPTFEVIGADTDCFAPLTAAENALSDLNSHIAETDAAINLFLQDALGSDGYASNYGPDGTFPSDSGGLDLTPATASDYAHPGAKPDPNVQVPQVVVDFVNLYRAGAVVMPRAADMCDAGASICTRVNITGVYYEYPSTVSNFNAAADRLGNTMLQIRDDLRSSGDALVMAATHYQDLDAAYREQIQTLESQVRLPSEPDYPF